MDKNLGTENKWEIDNIEGLDKVAAVVLDMAIKNSSTKNGATVIALHGDLGSGKTTFTKRLAKMLGIEETITSPTFVIQKQFSVKVGSDNQDVLFKKFVHIDTYRIDLQDELVKLGWNENVGEKENLIAVEWPENIPDILPEETIHLYFTFIDETTRLVEMK